jgi:hypothetical protein
MSKQQGPPEGYVEVNERIIEFRLKYPDGTLQSEIVPEYTNDGRITIKAYAFRTPDDPRPGTGYASEPVPGKTPFTRDSELMNAETSAWGRALIAVGAADAKRGIASANEVRNRQQPKDDPQAHANAVDEVDTLLDTCDDLGIKVDRRKAMDFARVSLANAKKTIANLTARLEDSSDGVGGGEAPAPSEGQHAGSRSPAVEPAPGPRPSPSSAPDSLPLEAS